jgi:hypothetical protein
MLTEEARGRSMPVFPVSTYYSIFHQANRAARMLDRPLVLYIPSCYSAFATVHRSSQRFDAHKKDRGYSHLEGPRPGKGGLALRSCPY